MADKKLKLGIAGLGPVGLILAVQFKSAGCEVAISDVDKDKMNLIRNNGIQLVGKFTNTCFYDYNFNTINELLEHDIDLLITAVKSYKIEALLETVEKYKHKDIFLLCAQNGIDIGQMYTSHFEESQILRMVINFAGNLTAPNACKVTSFNPPNYIASINDTHHEMARDIAETLTSTGMQTESVDSFTLADHVWKKSILITSISPICGLSKLSISEAMSSTDTAEIVEQTLLESMEVAKAEGIHFGENFVKLCLRELKNMGGHIPSLAVDILNNRQTEIDFFSGKIVDYGRKHYIQTPLNLTFTNLVNAVTRKANVKVYG